MGYNSHSNSEFKIIYKYFLDQRMDILSISGYNNNCKELTSPY